MSRNELRSSQMVTTFGPGAMVDLPNGSVIVSGLDHWHYELDSLETVKVEEPRLVEKLKELLHVHELTLRKPPPQTERDHGFRPAVDAWKFPEWFIVQDTLETSAGFRRRRLVHLNGLDKGKFRDEAGKKHSVVPVRFVRACPRGHIGDIDWKLFVHNEPTTCTRSLWLEERGTSGDLNDIWVVCGCKANRKMGDAATPRLKALGHCNGSRPWLGIGSHESCGRPNKLLIRSASNAYFSQLLSVISIPDGNSAVDDIVRSAWDAGLSMVDSAEKLEFVRQIPNVAMKIADLGDDVLMASIERIRQGSGDQRLIKEVEFDALTQAQQELGADTPDGDFYARTLSSEAWEAEWMEPIERVVLVHRLREVVAQVGFTRFEPTGPDKDGELDLDVDRAPLALDQAWLPAIENRGEGVFLMFRNEAIESWLRRASVDQRGRELLNGHVQWLQGRQSARAYPGLSYTMIHTLSHFLMTSIALECGYPASSLKERIYAMDGKFGLLIYTGSSDAEGTLGGLIQTGRDIRRHLRQALSSGMLCSNDPVCAFHRPASHDHQPLHGSACHGCVLVAETSCEQRNEYLDRALVVPTLESRGAEFFSGF